MNWTTMTAAASLILLGGVALSAGADEDYGPLTEQKTAAGEVLADANGMTVYTYDKDAGGKSNCTGECAEYWPPVTAPADAQPTGDLTVIQRADGTRQWVDEGKPLYTYSVDKKPGDMKGDGFKGVWHVVKPD